MSETDIQTIKDMCEGIKTSARTSGEDTKDFPIDIAPHQGSALTSFVFTIIMDVLTKEIQDEV